MATSTITSVLRTRFAAGPPLVRSRRGSPDASGPGRVRARDDAESEAHQEHQSDDEAGGSPVETDVIEARQPFRGKGEDGVLNTNARATPMMPPMTDSRMFSVRNCARIRPRFAPRAVLTATSRDRASVRVRSRFATLAQARSRRNPTAPSNTSNAGPTLAFVPSRRPTTLADASSICSAF